MAAARYRFRDFLLEPAARELWRGDTLQPLPASAFDCLLYLIEHRDRAVGRDELIAAVWGRVDITDNLLAQTVLRVRRVLGDAGSDGAIRTVARFGYRWVEPTTVEAGEVDAAASAVARVEPLPEAARDTAGGDSTVVDPAATVAPAAAVPRTGTRRVHAAVAIVATLCVLALAVLILQREPDTPPATADAIDNDSDAVASTDIPVMVWPAAADMHGWEWLRLGLMELVGNRLREGGLRVAPGEQVLATLAGQPGDAALPPLLRDAVRVKPSAHFTRHRWLVRLRVERGDDAFDIDTTSDDVLQAARDAADLVLVRLGHTPPDASAQRPLALEALLQQTRAAVLADQLDLAEQLIAQASPELRATPDVMLRTAHITQAGGDYASAAIQLQTLLDALPPDTAPTLHGRILLALGTSQFEQGALDAARTSFDRAIDILAPARDPIALAAAYGSRAAVAAKREDDSAEIADLGRARVEMQAGGDLLGLARVDASLGLAHVRAGRPALGAPLLREAEARVAAQGAREELAYVRSVLSGAQLQLLDIAAARATSDRTWPPELHTANERLQWRIALARVFVLLAQGAFGEADTLLQDIASEASPQADREVRDAAAALSAMLLAERGRHDVAVAAFADAMTPGLADTQPDLFLLAWTRQLRSQRTLDRTDEARDGTAALQAWIGTRRPSPWRQLHGLLAQAEQQRSDAGAAAALPAFAAVFAQARALGVPDDMVAVAEPYVAALLDAGDIDTAAVVVGLIAGWADDDARVAWLQARLFRAQGRIDAWRQAADQAMQLAGERPPPPAPID